MSKKNQETNVNLATTNIITPVPIKGVSYDSIKDQVKKVGYLKKLGGKGISKNWRKRFFAITNAGILYYFKHRTSSEPVGAINLQEYTKIYKDKSKKRYFLLVNENNPSQRVFHLIADTEEELSSWINEITEFFEDDISDFKNQLSGVAKQKKEKRYYDTLKRKEIKSARVEEYDLEKLQLVFKGDRLSLLVKDGSVNSPISPDSTSRSNSISNASTLISINSTITTNIPLDNLSIKDHSSTTTPTVSNSTNSSVSPPSSSTAPTKTPRPPPRKSFPSSTSNDNLTPIIDDDDDDDSEESN
ncbi:hypothetical protein DICPUDRAFT_147887 [Dictyostelium purpureum]|uniref:PH domain-containing protein n=1 Tax=Dictyostelium purpureum TaxID=5786 RepID=F0Z9P0_DICPU|nr:uncharacterized protein DICPUDRAFT_147887 [Dictyostelium purpureum]EGC39357.1 hypothetical protein DICPUDRAFT_147887 [Dictyostelium purpureum]|eukprot:XP_003284145.1 hypothetical protein DICPUDRAFT_147887 [Dictyostelium purpureum]